jgi:hypothetical protein
MINGIKITEKYKKLIEMINKKIINMMTNFEKKI